MDFVLCVLCSALERARVCVYFLPVFTIAWIAILMTFYFGIFNLFISVQQSFAYVQMIADPFSFPVWRFFLFKCHVKKNDDWTWTALWILSTELKWFEKTHVWNAMPACRIPTMKVYTLIIIRLYEIIFRCVMWSKVKSESFFRQSRWMTIHKTTRNCLHSLPFWISKLSQNHMNTTTQTDTIHMKVKCHSFCSFFFSSIWIISVKCYVICCSKDFRLRTHKPWEATPKFYL